jgi:hypothetical protein
MTDFVCSSCGFTSQDSDARFCPNCGGTLEESRGRQVPAEIAAAPSIQACPRCGSTANAPGARFCQQCGGSLGGQQAAVSVSPVFTPAAVAPLNFSQPAFGSGSKAVTGLKIKMMPIAKLIENGVERSGVIELHSDGILFLGPRQSIIASLHVSDIARASPGIKSHFLDVQMKDGSQKTFKFMNARDWAGIVNSNLR